MVYLHKILVLKMKKSYILLLALIILPFCASAQEQTVKEADVIRFDRKVHDFGDVLIAEGPVKCTFTFTNVSDKPIVINNVISSCGCTTPEWTKSPVKAGADGTISAVYSNDQGPYPFDKTLTVYLSSAYGPVDRPVVLRLRGVSHEQKKDLDELFADRIGSLGIRKTSVSIGYIDQGTVKSDFMQVANMSRSELTVEGAGLAPGISIEVFPNPIPARSMARLTYTVDTKVLKDAWGKQSWKVGFKGNGRTYDGSLTVTGIIKEGFDSLTKEQIANAAVPVIDKSYFEFGEVKKGASFDASYVIKNKGKSPLVIHHIDGQGGAKVVSPVPVTIAPGGKATVKVKFDTSKLDYQGEVIEILTLITNSPSKPIVNLFVTGYVK